MCVASYSKERGEEEGEGVWEEGREELGGEGEREEGREEGRNGKGGRTERKRGINGYQQKMIPLFYQNLLVILCKENA